MIRKTMTLVVFTSLFLIMARRAGDFVYTEPVRAQRFGKAKPALLDPDKRSAVTKDETVPGYLGKPPWPTPPDAARRGGVFCWGLVGVPPGWHRRGRPSFRQPDLELHTLSSLTYYLSATREGPALRRFLYSETNWLFSFEKACS